MMATVTSCSAIASTLQLPPALAQQRAGRRPRNGTMAVCTTTRPIEAARPDRLGQPRIGGACAGRIGAADRDRDRSHGSRTAARVGAVLAPFIRSDSVPAVTRLRQVSAPAPAQPTAPSALAASNNWIGAPGITVLIACL